MKSIRQIAASLAASTTAEAKRALKSAGMKQTLAAEVLSAKVEIDRARADKRATRRALYRLPNGRPPVRIPTRTPQQRLETARKAAVARLFTNTFRQPRHGELSVILTDDPAKVGVGQREYDDWNLYAKSYKHGPAKCLDNIVRVPATWRVRVQRRGIAVLDGMMTLDATAVEGAPDGVSLYAATWAAQGRGNSVNVSNGYIAVSGGLSYHTDSPYRALSGLKRKSAAAAWIAELRCADLDSIVSRCPGAVVRLSDARAIGAFEYGIKAWCSKAGIDYAAGSATVARVYEAYQAIPAPEARAAILHAVRRARKHLAVAA